MQVRVLLVQDLAQMNTGLRPEVLQIRVASNLAIQPRVVLVTISLVVVVRPRELVKLVQA